MNQALYRRYRSKTFADVVGQEHITSLLEQAVKREIISHAYLFTGPRGTGKTSVARILAHAVNKLPYSETPHLDIIEIDAASNRRIDDIRDLRDKVHIAPTSAKYKVYIIDEVHMLTGESFNALLKTLEEPPAHVIFILATTELHKVPATIVSRTQRFHFRPGSKEAITNHLLSVSKKEKIAIKNDAAELIAEHSEGGFRDALSLLDQIASSNNKSISRHDVEQLLGIAPSEKIDELLNATLAGETKAATNLIRSLFDMGTSSITIATQLSQLISKRAENHPELYELLNDLLDVNRSSSPELKLLALVAKFSSEISAPIITTKKPSLAVVASPPKTVASKQIIKPAAQSPVEPESDQPDQESTNDTVKAANDIDKPKIDLSWEAVLEVAQKRAPALYGVLKRAEVECSSEKINLNFQYALHRKKLSDSRYRGQLSSMIENTFGCTPELVITDQTEQPLSSEVAAVADIMGGGKPVNA